MFWKINIIDKYQAKLFVFYLYSYLSDLVLTKLFQNFGRLYLRQMWEMNEMEVLHPKVAFLCRFWTQTATLRPNYPILTSSVKAILQAMINTVFGEQV